MELSIIVPIYNSEQFLERCVDSILKSMQGTQVELLLVNNNSTDSSPKLIQNYVKKYPGVVFGLNCKTPSAGAARNYGVQHAKGKHLWFIDADDTIEQDAVKLLLNTAQKHQADLVMFGATKILLDGTTPPLRAIDMHDPNYDKRFVRSFMGPWQLLIRRAWWQAHGITFKEGMIHEDMELMSSLILYPHRYASVAKSLYNYYETPGSILHATEFNPRIFDIFPALESLMQRFESAHAVQKYYSELEWFFIWNLLVDSAHDFAQFKAGHPGFSKSRQMLRKYFPHWRRNPILKQSSWKLRLKVRLNYWR